MCNQANHNLQGQQIGQAYYSPANPDPYSTLTKSLDDLKKERAFDVEKEVERIADLMHMGVHTRKVSELQEALQLGKDERIEIAEAQVRERLSKIAKHAGIDGRWIK